MKRKGFRSEFERGVAHWLIKNGITYEYELQYIEYQPKIKRYTPDFYLTEYDFHLELKGHLDVVDRVKHLFLKTQNPHLDVRFIFPNSKKKIYKGSKTSYADWCNRHDFLYADNRIPNLWLKKN